MIWLRAVLFVLVVQAVVVGLVPYLLAQDAAGPRLPEGGWRAVGLLPLILGVAALAWCNWAFVARGRGTAAPYDPPRELVATGLYRWTRNPMYVSALSIVLGIGVWTGSVAVLVYAAALAVVYALFVRFYEEPKLRRSFGASYERYRAEVPRWLPRPPRRAV
ncbi:MAG TPA: isoprenylcysteine carboxylmethyltransferase family protein [Longimicrobiaceae bacterium]|nr:isoprenylcysteine carboxylmethyltransferase family protein [Longimicrobiaceae bacterium]